MTRGAGWQVATGIRIRACAPSEYLLHLLNDKGDAWSTLQVNRAALKFLKRPRLPTVLSPEEITRMLDRTSNLKHWTVLATFYATGLRSRELRLLKVSDIDSARMVLHVREGKGRVPREIRLSPVLLQRLRIYWRWRKPKAWLFPSKQRPEHPMDQKSVWSLCQNAARRAGVNKHVTPHDFRHYAASRTMPRVGARAAIHIGLSCADGGIVRLPAWHSGRMINQLFTFSSTIERLRQGPLSEHLDVYAGAVAQQGHAHYSIRQQIVGIADFSRWLKQKQIAVRTLDSKVLDRFLRLRCRQHRVRRGDPTALERLLAMLRQTGVVKPHQPPVVDNAQSRITSEFRRYLLHECGRSPATLLNYVPVIEKFLSERFHNRAPNFARLRAPDVTGFVMRHAHRLSPVRAGLMVTALRSFFRYL